MNALETNQTTINLRDAIHQWEDQAAQAYRDITLTQWLAQLGFTISQVVPPWPPAPAPVPVDGVTLNTHSDNLAIGTDLQLTATVSPSDATNQAVNWTSDAAAAATVDATGKVTGVTAGTAIITVTTVDGGYTDTCTVVVA